jgi:Spy/CpxP family protein refolding chaperone
MRHIVRITPLVALVFTAALTVCAQQPQDSPGGPPANEGPDPVTDLQLTQDQIRTIRMIQRDTKDERQAIGLRLRQSNRALQDALDAETLDEARVEQRLQDVAAAQTAQLRARIQTELRIRRILTPGQLAKWRDLRLQAGDLMRARDNTRPNRSNGEGLRPQRNGNGIAPLNPRRDVPLRNPRP